MILTLAIIVVALTIYFFIRDIGNQQVISSRFVSFYKPFKAETIVQHEYTSKPETIWQTLIRFEDYCLWFPGINRMLPIVDNPRYVHRFSFDRFSLEPGAFIKMRPKSFLPWFKGRIVGMEPNKKLEMEMRFNPVSKERVTFEINVSPSGTSEVICQRTSRGLFSFLTIWQFADKGSSILHNLSYFLPDDREEKKGEVGASKQESVPQLNRETIIAQAVQAGLDRNMDLINAIPDKPTRGLAKAALVKAKRLGKMPDYLAEALNAGPLSSTAPAATVPISGLPAFDNHDDLIAFVVNKALDGDMDPINSIPDKPLRGKAKAAMVKAKRTGERPPMPEISQVPSPADASPEKGSESDEEMVDRLVAAGLQGSMDEINALENKALRGKIKAAIVRAKRIKK